MAKATVKKVTEQRPVEVKRVVLELSDYEAEALAALFYYVGGDYGRSARGYTNRVKTALADAGYSSEDDTSACNTLVNSDYRGTLYFNPLPNTADHPENNPE
jgi:hypothetical protein